MVGICLPNFFAYWFIWTLVVYCQQTVCSIVATVDNVQMRRILVKEYEEVVAEKFHLDERS